MPNWNDVFREIQERQNLFLNESKQSQYQSDNALIDIRRKYLSELHKYTTRNILAYYSGYLSKPGISGSEITDEDKNGFMMAIHKMDRKKGLDLILHTPGGGIAATESIAHYLHQMFGNNIRAIVPQICMSAGTMLACACKSIVLAKHSNLGPTDPHISNIPALGVIEEFKRAAREIKRDQSKINVWRPILSQYRPTFIGQCEDAIKWTEEFVTNELKNNMLSIDSDKERKAKEIAKMLMDKKNNKSHGRHLHLDKLKKAGLIVEQLEDDDNLQDLVLTVHHCYMHTLMNTTAIKIIENHNGVALAKTTIQ
uniref:Serine dehydrogenase proteinase n=2 Tax=Candidatus Kentrum sp. TUN TaxID=2126343 RepID=A0A450ZDL6_9GAMM|nr:MAG: Serine dehydrogenase proteinase [Candidatus Kentron sp. TUN]